MVMRAAAAIVVIGMGVAGCGGDAGCDEDHVEIEDGVCVSAGDPPGYTGSACSQNGASSGGSLCEMDWICGVDTLALECEAAGTGFLCRCNENAVSTFDFFSPNACAEVTFAYRAQVAADNCNWPVTWVEPRHAPAPTPLTAQARGAAATTTSATDTTR
jgi:hypothetical protein